MLKISLFELSGHNNPAHIRLYSCHQSLTYSRIERHGNDMTLEYQVDFFPRGCFLLPFRCKEF